MVAAIGAFGGVVARTAAQGGVARAATSTTSAARSANIASSVSGAVGNTVSQARSGKSAILDSRGNAMITPARSGIAPTNTGSVLEQNREKDALQERMIQLLQSIADNTSGKSADAKAKPQQTLAESVMATLGSMAGGVSAMLAGFGLFRGFKDAAAAREKGESEFGIFAEFAKGTIKGILNIPLNILDNILNIFDIDIPDNMGDLIVDGAISMVKNLADYIKNLPDRIMKAITGMIENIGIPEFKILGKSFGPYYPFRGDGEIQQEDTQGSPTTSKTIMPESKNKEGISDDLNLKEFSPTVPVTTSSDKATKKPFDAAEYKKLEGTTSFIKDPATGEGMTMKKTSREMTKQQAMEVLGNQRNQSMIKQINGAIKFAFRDGKPIPDISELPFMSMEATSGVNNTPERRMFTDAVHKVYPELMAKLWDSKTKDGKNASDLLKDLNDPMSDYNASGKGDGLEKASQVAKENFDSVFQPVQDVMLTKEEYKKKGDLGKVNTSLVTSQSDSGNAIMDSSAAAEAAKSKESSNVVINAPSSTINAPKSSNMVMPENIRNSEPSMSRYVDGLNGVNI
jgi:hypothetical protein